MSVLLRTGEILWNHDGNHVWDTNGFCVLCSEDTEVTFDSPEIETTSLSFIRTNREFKGLDPDTGLPPE